MSIRYIPMSTPLHMKRSEKCNQTHRSLLHGRTNYYNCATLGQDRLPRNRHGECISCVCNQKRNVGGREITILRYVIMSSCFPTTGGLLSTVLNLFCVTISLNYIIMTSRILCFPLLFWEKYSGRISSANTGVFNFWYSFPPWEPGYGSPVLIYFSQFR